MDKSTYDPEKELVEKEILRREIRCMQSYMPDAFSSPTGLATSKPGRAETTFGLSARA